MEALLHEVEVRVVGALIEKEITTPEYYPLTLNALVAACNQKSNRDPVMSLDEGDVKRALETLQPKRLIATIIASGSRAPKYEQRLSSHWNLGRREIAVLDVLMLRGPQTVGEIRDRAERMYSFQDLDEVESTLEHMMQRQPPLVTRLARQVGRKEPRYAHLLSGEPTLDAASAAPEAATASYDDDRIAALEEEVRRLRAEFDDLKRQLLG